MFRVGFLLLAIGLFSPCAAGADPLPPTVSAGDEFTLADGRTVHLEGIAAPFAETSDLAEQSRLTLEKLLKAWEPEMENISTDRYGRTAAQVFGTHSDGMRIWLQEMMLRAGMAFIYPPTGHEPNLEKLFEAEGDARAFRRGIWGDEHYADIPADKAAQAYGRFAFITGKIVKAERIKGKVYLNFGANWKTDFTIVIAAHDLKAFEAEDLTPSITRG